MCEKADCGCDSCLISQQIEADVVNDWNGFFQMELTSDVVERSLELARIYALLGADCVQLASAVILKEKLELESDEFTFITSDLELKAAALRSGLMVLDPQEQAENSAHPTT
jgi:hypothetical protein